MSTKILDTLPIKVPTQQRSQMVEITSQLQAHIARERLEDAVIIIYSPHTTAGVCIQENADPDVKVDLLAKLVALIPQSEPYYQHREGNSDSHLKTVLTGNSVTVIVERGKLMLGKWQGIYLCEFDGPRDRVVWVKIIHERVHRGERD